MRTRFTLLALSACAGTYEPRPKVPEPKQPDQRSYSERLTDADNHDKVAAAAEGEIPSEQQIPVAERFYCGDTVLNDQLTTGGLLVTYFMPCMDVATEGIKNDVWVAGAERTAARHDRQSAAQLALAEANACRGIPAQDRDESVFARRKDIASIEPVRENDEVHGVRVVFASGVSADRVRNHIACTRARWQTLGRDPATMPEDPTLVDGADVQVLARGGHTEVVVLTSSVEGADVALARARGELTAEK